MIFIGNFAKNSDTEWQAGIIHYMPMDPVDGLHMSQEQLEAIGIFVDSIPEPTTPQYKMAVLCYNPTTQQLFYRYDDRPKTQDEIINGLQEQNAQMLLALVQGGLM